MRLIVQRVHRAGVTLTDTKEEVSTIGPGLMVLVGISRSDLKSDAEFCARKLLNMKLFPSNTGQQWKMSVKEARYEVLLVSQFTLYGIMNGNKPDFHESMKSDQSREFYDNFVQLVKEQYEPEKIKNGAFGEMMDVSLVNNGPVTIQLDSRKFQYVETPQGTPKNANNRRANNNNSNNNLTKGNENKAEQQPENKIEIAISKEE